MTKPFLDEEKIVKAANVLKAVAHPVRLRIVDLLDNHRELTVGELVEQLSIEQSLVSHHLVKMADKNVIHARREGKNIFYSLTDKTLRNILKCINDCKHI